MEQSVESNSFEKFKEKFKNFARISDYYFFFKKKKEFSENPVNLDMGI